MSLLPSHGIRWQAHRLPFPIRGVGFYSKGTLCASDEQRQATTGTCDFCSAAAGTSKRFFGLVVRNEWEPHIAYVEFKMCPTCNLRSKLVAMSSDYFVSGSCWSEMRKHAVQLVIDHPAWEHPDADKWATIVRETALEKNPLMDAFDDTDYTQSVRRVVENK